jgi:hypothetical protein
MTGTQAVETLRLGQRVRTFTTDEARMFPGGLEMGNALTVWNRIVCEMESGTRVELLRPLAWVERQEARAGGTILLEMPEMDVSGETRVVSIEPWNVESGEGRLITAKFCQEASDVYDLKIWSSPGKVDTEIRWCNTTQ